jgi:hypothetical protein
VNIFRERKTNRKSFEEKLIARKKSPKGRRWSLVPEKTTKSSKNISVALKKSSAQNNDNMDECLQTNSEEYVRVPLKEYEAFKFRLHCIENKMNREFNTAKLNALKAEKQNELNFLNGPDKVEQKFNETLHEVEKLEDSDKKTEKLAKRLSRDLKIRSSAENAIVRSPSARKIGSLRRRRSIGTNTLSRTLSWHVGTNSNGVQIDNNNSFTSALNFYPYTNLKHSHRLGSSNEHSKIQFNDNFSEFAQSVDKIAPEKPMRKSTLANNVEVWTPATDFFIDPKAEDEDVFKTPVRIKKTITMCESEVNHKKTPMLPPKIPSSKRNTPMSQKKTTHVNESLFLTPSSNDTREARASIIQIRNRNAGMVAQKARLFDGMYSDSAKSLEKQLKLPRVPIVKMFENNKNISFDDHFQKTKKCPRAHKSPGGINRRMQLRTANDSPLIKTIKERNGKLKPREIFLKNEILEEISTPRKRQSQDQKLMLTPQSRRHSRTPTSSKKVRISRDKFSLKSPRFNH